MRLSSDWPAIDPKAAELVKLRYFAGLTGKQAAEVLGISPRTADSPTGRLPGPGSFSRSRVEDPHQRPGDKDFFSNP